MRQLTGKQRKPGRGLKKSVKFLLATKLLLPQLPTLVEQYDRYMDSSK